MTAARRSSGRISKRKAQLVVLAAVLFFLAMIGLIRFLKTQQENAAQQRAQAGQTLIGSLPKLTANVMDMAGVIAPAERARLNEALASVYDRGGPQIVVATRESLSGATIADDGIQIARHWRIGHAGKNDGVLLLIAQHERKARIEVGYGLEGVLTDAASRLIIRNRMDAHLQAGEWTAAAREGVDGILDIVGATPPAANAQPSASHPDLSAPQPMDGGDLIGIGFFALVGTLIGLGVLQGIALSIPGVEKRLKASKRWRWIARWRILGSSGGSSSSSDSSSSSSSSSGSSSDSSSSDSGGGGDFGGGGAND